MKTEVYKRKVNTWHELHARTLVAADQNKPENQPLETTRFFAHDLQIGIFQHLLLTVTNLQFICKKVSI
jgi:hypothetical protein